MKSGTFIFEDPGYQHPLRLEINGTTAVFVIEKETSRGSSRRCILSPEKAEALLRMLREAVDRYKSEKVKASPLRGEISAMNRAFGIIKGDEE